MMPPDDSRTPLLDFAPTRDFFVGIDSDGCVFDTMEVKHKECFIPMIVQVFGLASISRMVREAAEFLNLYSRWRGVNRFPGLVQTFDLLADRPEVALRGVTLPRLDGLRDWLGRETRLSNPALQAEVDRTNDPDLILAMAWSQAVNRAIDQIVHGVPPFPFVREGLQALDGKADVMVVSATPTEALEREWREHGLRDHVALIAGQELGSKKDVLAQATKGRYDPHKVLMIGDAPGDLSAAQANSVLFYPIDPGLEDQSWKRFHEEALPRFFEGTYAGDFMDDRVERFLGLLPEVPPWKTG